MYFGVQLRDLLWKLAYPQASGNMRKHATFQRDCFGKSSTANNTECAMFCYRSLMTHLCKCDYLSFKHFSSLPHIVRVRSGMLKHLVYCTHTGSRPWKRIYATLCVDFGALFPTNTNWHTSHWQEITSTSNHLIPVPLEISHWCLKECYTKIIAPLLENIRVSPYMQHTQYKVRYWISNVRFKMFCLGIRSKY